MFVSNESFVKVKCLVTVRRVCVYLGVLTVLAMGLNAHVLFYNTVRSWRDGRTKCYIAADRSEAYWHYHTYVSQINIIVRKLCVCVCVLVCVVVIVDDNGVAVVSDLQPRW